MTVRELALKWWNTLTFEGQYFQIVKHKELIAGYPDRDPISLTGREIESLWIEDLIEDSTVRQNLIRDPSYTPYCGNNISRTAIGGCNNPRTIRTADYQYECPKCGFISQFPSEFVTAYKHVHNLK